MTSLKRSQLLLKILRVDVPLARELYALAVVALSLYFFFSLATFNPWDASMLAASSPALPSSNAGGELGARLAAVAFYFFGLAAYLLPLPFLNSILFFYRQRQPAWWLGKSIAWVWLILTAAIVLESLMPSFSRMGISIPASGLFGRALETFLGRQLGNLGHWLLLLPLALVALMLVFEFRLSEGLLALASRLRSAIASCFKRREPEGDRSIPVQEPSFLAGPGHAGPLALDLPELDRDHEAFAMFGTSKREKAAPPPQLQREALSIAPLEAEEAEPIDEENAADDERAAKPLRADSAGRAAAYAQLYRSLDLSIFKRRGVVREADQKDVAQTASLLVQVLEEFGVKGEVIAFQPGPVITVYEFQPEPGVKQAKILTLIDDIALALKVDSIFILPVKGKRALGIQVPNRSRQPCYLGDLLNSSGFQSSPSPLTLAMGLAINGDPACADLGSMPHLLMAGATGSGKSVAINAMLTSIIAKSTPEQVRMILVDPKMLELSVYEGIPHLLMPVITEADRAATALKWAVSEMERRYKIMQHLSVRNLESFNQAWTAMPEEQREVIRVKVREPELAPLPMIVLVIDELADLMLTAPKEVENCIQRLAQKARASGIHMILATQRPSVDIITGVIKANLPCRIAFQVVSRHDSRTILDQMGAEKLLGKGDMLFMRPGLQRLERLQGALISDEEVVNFVKQFKVSDASKYDRHIMDWIDQELVRGDDAGDDEGRELPPGDDPKFDEAMQIARQQGSISASFLQRRLKIGYNRAARIVETMESMGLVEAGSGAKPRAWLGRD